MEYCNDFLNHIYPQVHNSQSNRNFTLGHNKFSHLSFEDWQVYVRSGYKKSSIVSDGNTFKGNNQDLPTSVDWTKLGAVTPVKDQGQCGSCWSFSTTGALEGIHQIKYGTLLSLSEQNLVDCDNWKHGGRDHGCNGGMMDNAFEWIQKNEGLCSEGKYAYVSGETTVEGKCDLSCEKIKTVVPDYFTNVEANSDIALMSALVKQPVSVAIQANQREFQLYKSGVFTSKCGNEIDHAVLAVGYGSQDGIDYYKVKNSWGDTWGEDGYILLERGVSQPEGQCGILSGPPIFPTLA